MDTAEQIIRGYLKGWVDYFTNRPVPEIEVSFALRYRLAGKAEFLYIHLSGETIGRCVYSSRYTLDRRLQIAPPPPGKKLKDRSAYYTEMAKRIFARLKLEALPSLKLES